MRRRGAQFQLFADFALVFADGYEIPILDLIEDFEAVFADVAD